MPNMQDTRFDEIDRRIGVLQSEVRQRFEELENEVRRRLDALEAGQARQFATIKTNLFDLLQVAQVSQAVEKRILSLLLEPTPAKRLTITFGTPVPQPG